MFYDKFKQLCNAKGISCNRAALEIGLSNATPTKWKKTGATPDSATLYKVSKYFEVPIAYLLGNTDDPADKSLTHWAELVYKSEAPTPEGERPITFDDFTYAMYEESKELTEENKKKLLEMAQFFRQQQEKDKQK